MKWQIVNINNEVTRIKTSKEDSSTDKAMWIKDVQIIMKVGRFMYTIMKTVSVRGKD